MPPENSTQTPEPVFQQPPKRGLVQKFSESAHADWWLWATSFAESSFFLLPPDTLMIAIMSHGNRHKKWFYYAGLTTLFSVTIISIRTSCRSSDIFSTIWNS